MYETVEEFLGSGNSLRDLAAYDFKNESPQKEVRQERNPKMTIRIPQKTWLGF